MHISPYEFGNIFNKDPLRNRKLLLNRREINKLIGLVQQKGMSLIPISLYWSENKVKVEVGIGKGKKLYDKREDIAKKDAQRKIERALKERNY
jgi:SsrA-binding protein